MTTVDEPLAATAARRGGGLALRAGEATLTWSALDERVAALAGRLREVAAPGSRVGLLAPAGPDFVTAVHACLRAGLSVVPLAHRSPAAEVVRHVADCAAAALLVSPDVPHAAEVVAASGAASFSLSPGLDGVDPIGAVGAAPRAGGPVDPAAELCVLYTSGSSGTPKGVRLTVANHLASAAGCEESLGRFTPDDVWVVSLGANRVGGFATFIRSAWRGFAVDIVPRFDETAVIDACQRGATITAFVPAMLHRLLDGPRGRAAAEALAGLRAIMVGGAPAPARSVQAWAEAGLRVCPTYGMTESCSQVATVPPGRALELLGSVGPVHGQAVVSVDGADGPGGPGELVVSGPVVSPGYVHPPPGSGFRHEGDAVAFRTGDVGAVGDDGALRVLGRLDLTINTGGEKVQPEEVEAVLAAHPGVQDAGVRGADDPVYGQRVEAVIAGGASAEELKQWCAGRLAPHKVPRRWVFVDAVPRSEDGKLLRRRLADV